MGPLKTKEKTNKQEMGKPTQERSDGDGERIPEQHLWAPDLEASSSHWNKSEGSRKDSLKEMKLLEYLMYLNI